MTSRRYTSSISALTSVSKNLCTTLIRARLTDFVTRYDAIKCQIMLYLRTYLQSIYYIDREEKKVYFIEICKSLAQENTVNTCVRYHSLHQ